MRRGSYSRRIGRGQSSNQTSAASAGRGSFGFDRGLHACIFVNNRNRREHMLTSARPGGQESRRPGGVRGGPGEGAEWRAGVWRRVVRCLLLENKVWLHQPCRSIFPLDHVSAGVRWGGAALTRPRRRSGTHRRCGGGEKRWSARHSITVQRRLVVVWRLVGAGWWCSVVGWPRGRLGPCGGDPIRQSLIHG